MEDNASAAVERPRAAKHTQEDGAMLLCTLAYAIVPTQFPTDQPLYPGFVVCVGSLLLVAIGLLTLAPGLFYLKTGRPSVGFGAETNSFSAEDREHNMAVGLHRTIAGGAMMATVLIAGTVRMIMHGINPFDPALWAAFM